MWPKVQLFLVVLGAFMFQAAIVPHISIAGAKPDVILIIAALYGFMYGSSTGSLVGFTGGLLGNLLVGSYIGPDLLSKSLVGFLAGLIQRIIFVENILFPMLAIFVATGLNEVVYIGFMFLLGETVPLKLLLVKTILPSALYNSLLTPFVYLAARRFMVFKQDALSVRIANKYE